MSTAKQIYLQSKNEETETAEEREAKEGNEEREIESESERQTVAYPFFYLYQIQSVICASFFTFLFRLANAKVSENFDRSQSN